MTITVATVLRAVLGLALTLAAASSALADGAWPAVPPFQFHESALNVTWTAAGPEASATVVNNTTADLTLLLILSPLGLERDGKPIENASALRLIAGTTTVPLDGSGTLRLPAAGSVVLRLVGNGPSRQADEAPPAFLSASDVQATRWVARIPVATAASTTKCSTPPPQKALVDKATITLVRYPLLLGWETCANCRVPVSAGSFVTGMVGHLTNEKGGIVRIDAAAVEKGTLPSIRLDPMSRPGPGTYRGKIDLHENEKAGDVDVTLQVKHDPSLPLLVLIASVGIGLVAKRFLTSGRAVWAFRAREAALDAAFASSQAAFDKAAAGRSYAGMSIEAALAAARRAALLQVDEAETANESLGPEGARYQSIAKELTAIETAVRAWAILPMALAPLEHAALAAKDASQAALLALKVPSLGKEPPTILREVAKLLAPRALESLEAIAALRSQADTARQRVEAWLERARTATRLHGLLATHAGPDADAVHDALRASIRALWAASENLGEVDAKLSQAAETLDKPRRAATDARDSAPAPVPEAATTAGQARESRYRKALVRWDTGVALLAFAVAVATGLRDLYLDQPFGTVKDYVSLALLGFTARLAVDLVGAAIDRLAIRR